MTMKNKNQHAKYGFEDLFDSFKPTGSGKSSISLPLNVNTDDIYFNKDKIVRKIVPSILIACGFEPSKIFRGDNLNRVFGNYVITKKIKGSNKAGTKGSFSREVLVFRAMDSVRKAINSEQYSYELEDVSLVTMLAFDRLRLMEEDEDPIALADICCEMISKVHGMKKHDRNGYQAQKMRELRAERKVQDAAEKGEELIFEDVLAQMTERSETMQKRREAKDVLANNKPLFDQEKSKSTTYSYEDEVEKEMLGLTNERTKSEVEFSFEDDIDDEVVAENYMFSLEDYNLANQSEDDDVRIVEKEETRINNKTVH